MQCSKENTNKLHRKGGREFNKPDMDAWSTKVTGNEDTVSRWPHRCQEARSLHIHGHEVWEWLFPETLDDVLVVFHHVRRNRAVEAVSHLDGVVYRVLHQGPRGERGSRHQNGAVKQAWHQVGEYWTTFRNNADERCYKDWTPINVFSMAVWHQVSTVLSIKFKVKLMKIVPNTF